MSAWHTAQAARFLRAYRPADGRSFDASWWTWIAGQSYDDGDRAIIRYLVRLEIKARVGAS